MNSIKLKILLVTLQVPVCVPVLGENTGLRGSTFQNLCQLQRRRARGQSKAKVRTRKESQQRCSFWIEGNEGRAFSKAHQTHKQGEKGKKEIKLQFAFIN